MTIPSGRPAYFTDLTDEQFALLEPSLPPAKTGGRPRTVNLREILNGCFYQTRTGCQWRAMPHDLPKWSHVAYYYYKWMRDGTWDRFLTLLREGIRAEADKEPTPSMVIIDSQTVKGTEMGGDRGWDGNKKINGKKRHILVDTLGLLCVVVVTAASVLDGAAASIVMGQVNPTEYPRLKKVLGDNAYGKCQFPQWVKDHGYYELEIKERDPEAEGFKVIQWRWIVERTIAWLGRYRRNSKDYEKLNQSSETRIRISSIHRMRNYRRPRPGQPPFQYPRKQAESS